MPKIEKTRAPFTLITALLISASVFLCLVGTLVSYVICIDRVSEFSNSLIYKDSWIPFSGDYVDYVRQLPDALYDGVVNFPKSAIASLALLPVLIFVVPIHDAWMLEDFSFLLKGALPFVIGTTGILLSVYLRDKQNAPKVEALEFDD